MKTKQSLWTSAVVGLGLLLGVQGSLALPALQLDVSKGVYVGGDEETIFATSSQFTLYALVDPKQLHPEGKFYISMALRPMTTTPSPGLGSFSFNGDSIFVTGDMVYGVPPVETVLAGWDSGDLSKHGIFETYYYEYGFNFVLDGVHKAVPYNTEDYPGGPSSWSSGDYLYFMAFEVDTSGLPYPYTIHFDLYDTFIVQCKQGGNCVPDIDVKHFAPFSHDANSAPVPEPATLLLLGSGLAGVGFLARGRNRPVKCPKA